MKATEFFASLDERIAASTAWENDFYRWFRKGGMSRSELKIFADQYFYYIRTFPQILAGLSHRVDIESVRAQLAKTVVSELGDGDPDRIHFRMFENALAAVGVSVDPIDEVTHIPEASALVDGIRELFLNDSVHAALGAHYTIEQTGLPMISSLYEGFRTLEGSTIESMEYFYLHLLVEHEHVEWITAAVAPYLDESDARADIERGAMRMTTLLGNFWAGLARELVAAPVSA
jgi:pyrroloquinoline-quinone synthase